MPRRERPLDAGDDTLLRFANDLRQLRHQAELTYRGLAERTHYSIAALSEAAAGRKLPTLAVTLAYVRACGGNAEEWEKRWHAVTAERTGAARGEAGESAPYPGLAAFQPADADRFFGRERLVEDLVGKLARQRFVAVFGASGAGKSSLLRAGLLPRWRLDRSASPIVSFTPGARPLEECAIALCGIDGGMPGARHAELRADPRGLHRLVRQMLAERPADAELVLVVDQFEEVFTLCRDADERQRFIEMLLTAVRAENSRCRIVLGIRADFYARCTEHAGLVEAARDSHVVVGPMTPGELRRAITQPAVRSGCIVETSLLTDLVAQVYGQAGGLPLLSHVLSETWRRRRGNTLTRTGFQAAGGIEGALAQAAESVYSPLTQRQRRTVKDLMLRLTAFGAGTDDTKRRVTRDELDDSDPDTAVVLDRLAHARLITLDRDSVELAHEALIHCWPRLRGWRTEDRAGLRIHRQLTEAAGQWEGPLDRDAEALYRGTRLAIAHGWATARERRLSPREARFLQASLDAMAAEQAAARRRGRRLRQAAALLCVLLVFAVCATTYAVQAKRTAVQQRNAALSQIVAVRAAALRRSDAALAAQLSLAAYRLAPTEAARDSLLAAFPLPYQRRLTGHVGNVNSVAFSPDGRTLATSSRDRSARLWDVTDPLRPRSASVLIGHSENVNAVAFSPDGRTVVTAGWDDTAILWDATDRVRPTRLATLRGHTDDVNGVAFSPDGRILVTASNDHTAKLWDVNGSGTPRLLRTLTGHADAVAAAAFAPDGRTLTTGSFDRTAAIWDLAGRRPPRFLAGLPAPVTWVAYDRAGTRLATVSADQATVWDPANGGRLGSLGGHLGTIRSVSFNPADRTVATSGEDITARLWDVSDPDGYRQVARLEAQAETLSSVAFSPDGRMLATGSDDDTAVLWKLPESRPDQTDVGQIAKWVCEAVDAPISEARWATYFPGLDYRPPCPR